MSAAGLPDIGQLPIGARALYHGAVGSDLLLRTGLSTVLTLAAAPTVITGRGGTAEREALRLYADAAAARDPAAVFAPPPPVEVSSRPGRAPGISNRRIQLLSFPSPYRAFAPQLEDSHAAHERNATARAQYWTHSDRPRDTLVVVHGFGASPSWFNSWFFGLEEFFSEGWDILMFTLPFHGSRRGRLAPVNGVELFSRGFGHFAEAMLQAIHDLRAFIDYVEARGAPRIGVTGLSLGGYTSALLASVDRRLDFAIPNAPVTSVVELLRSWAPAGWAAHLLAPLRGVSLDELDRALAIHSPLNYEPLLPKDRLLIVGGLGDRLAPPAQAELLWEHWERPAIHWFPGSHVLHFSREDYRTEMRRLMGRAGVG